MVGKTPTEIHWAMALLMRPLCQRISWECVRQLQEVGVYAEEGDLENRLLEYLARMADRYDPKLCKWSSFVTRFIGSAKADTLRSQRDIRMRSQHDLGRVKKTFATFTDIRLEGKNLSEEEDATPSWPKQDWDHIFAKIGQRNSQILYLWCHGIAVLDMREIFSLSETCLYAALNRSLKKVQGAVGKYIEVA